MGLVKNQSESIGVDLFYLLTNGAIATKTTDAIVANPFKAIGNKAQNFVHFRLLEPEEDEHVVAVSDVPKEG